jgi:acyl-CoA oxidase
MGDLSLRGALRYLGERAETSITELNPVQTRRTDPEHLRNVEFNLAALRYREERMLRSAALRMRARLRDGMDSFDAVNEVQSHLVALARAHVERVIAETFAEAVADAPTGRLQDVLERARALSALSRIEMDRGWFLESGYIEGSKSRAIRSEVDALCREIAQDSELLTAGFEIPDALLPEIARTG